MRIRPGMRADAEKIADWLKELWLLHCDNEPQYVSRKKIGAYPTRRILRYLRDCFNGSNKSYLLVAEEGGDIAGFLKIDVAKIESFYVETRVLYLDDIFVREEYRGRGVSKLLYEEAEKIARKRRIKWLKARVYEFNKPAQAMAKSMGLRPLYSEYFKILD